MHLAKRKGILSFEGKPGTTQKPASVTLTLDRPLTVCPPVSTDWITCDQEQYEMHLRCVSLMNVNEKADGDQREKNEHYQEGCETECGAINIQIWAAPCWTW